MPQPLIAGLPPDLSLFAGCQIRLNALNPTTGAQVTGVTYTNLMVYVQDVIGAAVEDLAYGEWELVLGPQA